MQHKSLFAALLCGALCLTACLKNEESPSVTQVRNAKAEELLSIATLNKANAEATLLLAKAEVKIKEAQAAYLEADAKYRAAEAEIRKAEAAKVLAEADLLKVQADLYAAEVAIKEQELLRMQEELKAQIAEYDARIAAATAEKILWEAQKQLIEKELEAALVEAEAALWDAKLSLFESEKAYNDAIAQAEADADAANKEALEELRALVADLNARYHAAALELLELQFEIAETNKLIAGLEADIFDAKDAKYAQIQQNNKEIARLTILRDALVAAEGKTTEELLDESANLAAALIAQTRVVADKAEAYSAAEDAYLLSIPNQVGVESDDPYYAVTYTYTQDFFVRNADQKELANLPVNYPSTGRVDGEYLHLDDNGNHHDAYIVEEYDPETGLTNVIYREQIWTVEYYAFWVFLDELIDVQDTLLYSYCDGLYEWGVKYNGLVRYPEIGEGISYDARTPYMTYADIEYIPLDINREGYEKYVFFINQMAENERDMDIADIDDDIADCEDEIAWRQEVIDLIAPVYEAFKTKLSDAKGEFDKLYEAEEKLYEDYTKLAIDYTTKYVVEGLIEVTDAWWVYQEAQAAYDAATQAADDYVTENKTYVKKLKKKITKAEATIAEETAYLASDAYILQQTMMEYYEGLMNQAKYELDQATAPYNAAKKALEDQKKLVEDKYTAAMKAQLDYYEAWAEWQAVEGGTGPKPDAVTEAETAMNDAWTAYYTENGKIAGLESDYSTKETAYNTADENYKAAYDTYKAQKDSVESHQKNIDDAQAVIDDCEAKLKEYDDTLATLTDAVDAALKDVEDAIAAWSKAAGTEAAQAVKDAYDAWYIAYTDLYDVDKNPVTSLLNKYGVILSTEDIDYYDITELYYTDFDELLYYLIEWHDYPEEFDYELVWYTYFGMQFDDTLNLQDLSPVAVYVLTEWYSDTIAYYNEEIDALEASKAIVEAAYEAQVEENNKYLTELDEVLVNEDVYLAGVAKTNELYAALIEADKAYFDETVKYMEIVANLEAVRAAYEESASIETLIAGLEEAIAEFEEDNEDWEDIDDDTVAVNKLKEKLELTKSKYDVDEALVESLKAELDAAVAALKATIAE